MRPIVTVTLNPAIDQTVWIETLVAGTTHRTAEARTSIGGKGINVVRTVARLGHPAFAVGIAGADQASAIESHLSSLGVSARFLTTPGETRINLKLIEQATGRLTEINGTGPVVPAPILDALERELLDIVDRSDAAVVVLAGSLPLGVEPSIYARWTRLFQGLDRAVPVLVDASDEALAAVVPTHPFLVKPNRVEAEALLGRAISGLEDGREAACEIDRLGPRGVLLSLGRLGAAASWAGQSHSEPAGVIDSPVGQRLSTVGAGDAMVARLAVEIAKTGSPWQIEPARFFEMCGLAVEEATRQIAGGVEPLRGLRGLTSALAVSLDGQGALVGAEAAPDEGGGP